MIAKDNHLSNLKHRLKDLKLSYQFLHKELQGDENILDYYKQEIKSAEKQIELALSSSN